MKRRNSQTLHSILTLLIGFLCVSPVAAEVTYWGRVISDLRIECDSEFERKPVNRVILTRIGETLQRKDLQGSIQLIYYLNLYKSIEVDAQLDEDGRVILTYFLKKKTFVQRCRINGAFLLVPVWPLARSWVPLKSIKEVILVNRDDEFTPQRLEQSIENIKQLFLQYGYYNCDVATKIEPVKGNVKRVNLTLDLKKGEPAKLSQLQIEGPHTFKRKKILKKMRNKTGKRFNEMKMKEDVERVQNYLQGKRGPLINAWKRLFGQGKKFRVAEVALNEISYNKEQNFVDINLSVQGGTQVKVDIERKRHFWIWWRGLIKETLYQSLPIVKEKSVDEDLIIEGRFTLEDIYEKHGYFDPKIDYQRKTMPQLGKTEIEYQVEKEKRLKVIDLNFIGNELVPDKKLKKQVLTGGFGRRKYLNEETLDEDIKAVRNLYFESGFPQVEISEPQIDINLSHETCKIKVRIDEYKKVQITSVDIEANVNLTKEFKLHSKPGRRYIERRVNMDISLIYAGYIEAGYKDVQVSKSLKYNQDHTQVALTYLVDAGNQYFFGKVIIKGYSLTQRKIIYREIQFQEGKPYNFKKLLETQRRLYSLGIFRTVTVSPADHQPRPWAIDVIISVKEKQAGVFEFGAGYSPNKGYRSNFSVYHGNMFGYDRSVRLAGRVAETETLGEFTFQEPWMFNNPYVAEYILTYKEEERDSFDFRSHSFTVKLSRSYIKYLKVILEYQYEKVNLFNVVESPDRKFPSETISSIQPSMLWDTRNDLFNPSKGIMLAYLLKIARKEIGSARNFTKFSTQLSWFTPWKDRVIAASFRFGVGDNLPVYEFFEVGGQYTLRGFRPQEIGPNILVVETSSGATPTTVEKYELLGGNTMAVFNMEIRQPVTDAFHLALFYDTGYCWEKFRNISFSDLRQSIGLGLIWQSPIGPLRLDYGHKLDRKKYFVEPGRKKWEIPGDFYITLGHIF